METIVNRQLMNHLERQQLLVPHHFEICRGLGTADALQALFNLTPGWTLFAKAARHEFSQLIYLGPFGSGFSTLAATHRHKGYMDAANVVVLGTFASGCEIYSHTPTVRRCNLPLGFTGCKRPS